MKNKNGYFLPVVQHTPNFKTKKTADKPSYVFESFTAKAFNQKRVSAQELQWEILHIVSFECMETSGHIAIKCFSSDATIV